MQKATAKKNKTFKCPKCGKYDQVHLTLGHSHKPFRCARCDYEFDLNQDKVV